VEYKFQAVRGGLESQDGSRDRVAKAMGDHALFNGATPPRDSNLHALVTAAQQPTSRFGSIRRYLDIGMERQCDLEDGRSLDGVTHGDPVTL